MPPTKRTPFSQHVRSLRLRRGLTQREAAERAGISTASVSMAETASSVKDLWNTQIDGLARAYDVDPDVLFALADRIPPDLLDMLRGDLLAIKRARRALVATHATPTYQ